MANKEKLIDRDIEKRFAYEKKQIPKVDPKKKEKHSKTQVIIAVVLAVFVLATLLYPLVQMIMDNL